MESNIFGINLSVEYMDSTSTCYSFATDKDLFEALRIENVPDSNRAARCLDSYKSFFFGYMLKEHTNRNINFSLAEYTKDLEDAYQDAMIAFINKARNATEEYEVFEKASIKTQMFAIALNKYKMLVRKRAIFLRHRGHYGEAKNNEEILNLFEEVIRKERKYNLQQAINKLEDNCTELLDKRYIQGLEPRAIVAEAENANNISQRVLRCREKLKKILISYYGYPESFL